MLLAVHDAVPVPMQAGRVCFSLCMMLYLYGDLAIYCTAVAKSLRDVTCTAGKDGIAGTGQ